MCLYPKKVSVELQIEKGMPPFLPCGKCLECVEAYSREWVNRIMQEAWLYDQNCCVTLTYEPHGKFSQVDLYLPDFQNFLKRLRRKLEPKKIRFFLCGEYGSKNNRPHGHCILFNFIPDDLDYFFTRNGVAYYKSKFLSDVWNHGFVLVSKLTAKSAKYCAMYLQKMDTRYHFIKPFTRMSLKPGIGIQAMDLKTALKTGTQFVEGHEFRLPRYYQKKLEELGEDFTELKNQRKKNAWLLAPDEQTLDKRRLEVKAKFGRTTVSGLRPFREVGFLPKNHSEQQDYFLKNLDYFNQYLAEKKKRKKNAEILEKSLDK